MALLRFLIFGLVLGGLSAVATQNMTLIRLVILGQNTLPLPIAFWLLGAMALGGMTSLLLIGLIEWAAYWSRRQVHRSYREATPVRSAAPPTVSPKRWNPFGRSTEDDDPAENRVDQPQPQPAARPSAFRPPAPPKEVVDADFRVIRPPSRRLEDD
jgi:hypothetical protein